MLEHPSDSAAELVLRIPDSWQQSVQWPHEALARLSQFLVMERAQKTVYPKHEDVFRALEMTPFEQVKVVLLGQDPYHGAGQAHGLAFSVPRGIAVPPSLKNIFKELSADCAFAPVNSGDLSLWALQGVLLLNTVLTVRAHEAHSHRGKGWEEVTDAIIRAVNAQHKHCVFVLWGAPARAKAALIDAKRHLILSCAHPSPLSAHRGFFGCRHFSAINHYLLSKDKVPINWRLQARINDVSHA